MYYRASSITLLAGTESGATEDTYAYDERSLVCNEVAGVGLTVVITVDATSLKHVPEYMVLVGGYTGTASHYITVSVYNHTLASYDEIGFMQSSGADKTYRFSLTEDHHHPTTGAMEFRFVHSVTSYNPSHDFTINHFGVQKGVLDLLTGEAVAGLTQAVGNLASGVLTPGTVNTPYEVSEDEPLVLYADADVDDVTFDVGAQWGPFLQEEDAEVWFTIKENGRTATSLVDVEATVTDDTLGIIDLDLTAEQLAVREGSYYWQLQVRRAIYEGVPPVLVRTTKRVMMEGRVYIKPTFKE